jgi:6-phosphogluconolactonase (cycloisomerase 2 family)
MTADIEVIIPPIRRITLRRNTVLVVLAVFAAAFVPIAHASEHSGRATVDTGGVVYAMTNADEINEILVFKRDRAGRLHPARGATTPTGGAGAASNAPVDPLGSQNALVYDAGIEMLFAVNAGDGTVTVFDTGPSGLHLQRRARVATGGSLPVSIAISEHRLYVLNAGGSGSVTTFEIGVRGQLTQIGSIVLGLSPGYGNEVPFDRVNAPSQVGIDALARHLLVTHAGGQEMLVAELDDDGVPTSPLVSTSAPDPVPFAFGLTRYGSTLLASASGFVSAFAPPSGGALNLTANVATGQAATCWIVVGANGYAYVSNTGSNTLSRVGYSRTGGLGAAEIAADLSPTGGAAPIDMTLAGTGGFLYTLDGASGTISGFAIDPESGQLAHVETQGGLPAMAGIQGIAARDF